MPSSVSDFQLDSPKGIAPGIVVLLSIALHVVLLIVFPLVSNLLWKSKKFERPKTFTLISAPLPPQPRQRINTPKNAPVQRAQRQEVKPEPKPVAKPSPTTASKPAQKQDAAQTPDEDLDELSSLLEALPAPVQVAAMGNFPYDWYINNIRSKVERHWTPPNESRDLFVIVSFTINRDGTVSNIRISKSSGKSVLDNLAVRAVTLASPFGRMPPAYAGDALELNMSLFPFRNQ